MRAFAVVCLCLGLCFGADGLSSVYGFFDKAKDGVRFKKIFQDNIVTEDLSSIYYAVQGMKYLNEAIPNSQDVCKVLKVAKKESVEQSFYAASAWRVLQCKDALSPEILKNAMATLDNTKAPLPDIMYAVYTIKALGNKVNDKSAAIKNLQDYLKKDDSVTNLGLVFHICAEVACGQWAVDRAEDALIQADEVDGKMLHWEGGLPATALVLTGILKLSKAPSHITPEQSVKLANYLLSRRSVQTVKGASLLLESITHLADDKQISPVCISLTGSGQVSADSDPVHISVSDLVGRPHPSVNSDAVVAQSATRLQDDVVVLSKQKLTRHPKEAAVYVLDLMKVKPERGLYKLALSAGTSSATLPIRVLGAIEVEGVEVGIGDVDGSSTPRLNSISFPKRLPQPMEADSLQRIIVKFSLREKGQGQIAKVHQAFVRLSSESLDHEVIFVAEPDSSKVYRMDLDVGSVAENFKYESGTYSVELIIGDTVISNPIRWTMADVNLRFAGMPQKAVSNFELLRKVKPEIVHMFREPDVRPPRIVSDVFTALCIAPMLLLFILWGKIGINVRNFPLSLSALGFHLGLGSILGLFVVFWLRLTMFETVRYLLAVGFITFICGNRLLIDIAAKRKLA